jgi:hypothetical protein
MEPSGGYLFQQLRTSAAWADKMSKVADEHESSVTEVTLEGWRKTVEEWQAQLSGKTLEALGEQTRDWWKSLDDPYAEPTIGECRLISRHYTLSNVNESGNQFIELQIKWDEEDSLKKTHAMPRGEYIKRVFDIEERV